MSFSSSYFCCDSCGSCLIVLFGPSIWALGISSIRKCVLFENRIRHSSYLVSVNRVAKFSERVSRNWRKVRCASGLNDPTERLRDEWHVGGRALPSRHARAAAGFANHTVNKSRGSTVESLITISDSYEKNSDCISCACFWCVRSSAGEGPEVSVDYFYDNLSGGNWIDVEGYGYGWQPDLAVNDQNWRPYADGYWAYTDDGWTWISYEDFGWATYHYGRWANLADYGWTWFPGEDLDWGPAWVSWRTGGDYVGWAPLPPRGPGVVYEGSPIGPQVDIEFDIGPEYYNFCEVRYIGEPVLRNYIAPRVQNVTYINNTVNVTNITVQNNVVYNYGPNYEVLSASRPGRFNDSVSSGSRQPIFLQPPNPAHSPKCRGTNWWWLLRPSSPRRLLPPSLQL